MRKLLLAVVLAAATLAAHAQDGRRYAVLSLVGDKLLLVQREMTTGSRLDRNTRVLLDLPDNSIDRAVTLAIDDALRKGGAREPILLASRDSRLYDASTDSADRRDGAQRVYQAVKPIVSKTPATHLVLVTKHRQRAMLRLKDGHVGSGYLEGVGFYVDHGSYERAINANEGERGFIAHFTYLRVSVIDLSSGQVVAEDRVIGSEAATFVTNENIGNAWRALTEEEKVARLTKVIRDETSRVVPMVVSQR